MDSTNNPEPKSRLERYVLAALGVVCVGLAALGTVLPGLPTTIFLIVAAYLFTRSCPYLEERLIRNRLFAPYLRFLDEPATIPFRAKVVAIVLMWTCTLTSSAIFVATGRAAWIALVLIPAAAVGTWFILRWGASANQRIAGNEPAEPDEPAG